MRLARATRFKGVPIRAVLFSRGREQQYIKLSAVVVSGTIFPSPGTRGVTGDLDRISESIRPSASECRFPPSRAHNLPLTSNNRDHRYPSRGWIGLLCLLSIAIGPALALPQEPTGYLLEQEQRLEMIVYVVGEVQKPGEYRVPDRTDVLELLSKAGGPTEFSRLSSVTVRRLVPGQASAAPLTTQMEPRISIIDVDLEQAWKHKSVLPPPLLHPGDVVVVPRNSWYRYKRISTVIRDVAVVASTYFLYLRVVKD